MRVGNSVQRTDGCWSMDVVAVITAALSRHRLCSCCPQTSCGTSFLALAPFFLHCTCSYCGHSRAAWGRPSPVQRARRVKPQLPQDLRQHHLRRLLRLGANPCTSHRTCQASRCCSRRRPCVACHTCVVSLAGGRRFGRCSDLQVCHTRCCSWSMCARVKPGASRWRCVRATEYCVARCSAYVLLRRRRWHAACLFVRWLQALSYYSPKELRVLRMQSDGAECLLLGAAFPAAPDYIRAAITRKLTHLRLRKVGSRPSQPPVEPIVVPPTVRDKHVWRCRRRQRSSLLTCPRAHVLAGGGACTNAHPCTSRVRVFKVVVWILMLCVCACVHACVRACVRACVCVSVWFGMC